MRRVLGWIYETMTSSCHVKGFFKKKQILFMTTFLLSLSVSLCLSLSLSVSLSLSLIMLFKLNTNIFMFQFD